VRLAAVLDHRQIVGAGDGHDPVHVRGLAEAVNHGNRARAVRDLALDVVRVEVERAQINIGEDRHAAHLDDRRDRAHVRQRGRDDLGAGLGVDGPQRHVDRAGARGRADRVADAIHLAPAPLVLVDLRARGEDRGLACEHLE
jgi:hypothetical protein